jgi:hypothetical protein
LNRALKETYPGGIDLNDKEALIEQIKTGAWMAGTPTSTTTTVVNQGR